MKSLRSIHLGSELFVLTTSLAALSHSTWTLSTLFSGPEPSFSPAWIAWVLPGFLIAVSFDVGMLSVSHEIRGGDKARTKLLALFVLSVSMFLLQWGYIAHHMPNLPLGAGVRAQWVEAATFLRDSLLWVIPALLPIAVTLHTFSDKREPEPPHTNQLPTPAPSVATVEAIPVPAIERTVEPLVELPAPVPESVLISCPHCTWSGEYASQGGADRALIAHSRWCANTKAAVSKNGQH